MPFIAPTQPLSARPPRTSRCFTSVAVEKAIARISPSIADARIRTMFGQCLPNTLDTTVATEIDANGRPDTFVITGDIEAMWLRDSTNQGRRRFPKFHGYLPLKSSDTRHRSVRAELPHTALPSGGDA